MAKGIIYVMTTVVPGIVKIGKTGTNNFERRMYELEKNGYSNVTGHKREFAIEVEDYDEKETLVHELFSKSCVGESELFAVNKNLVIQLLSSFEGRQVFPKDESKEQVFDKVTEGLQAKEATKVIPDGTYRMEQKSKGVCVAKALMEVHDGKFIVKAGARCLPVKKGYRIPEVRKEADIVDGTLQSDVVCPAPSTAAWVVLGRSNNGWRVWKNSAGRFIDEYRKNDKR